MMVKPERLSLLKISIHRTEISHFLNEIPQFPYFHIREYKKEEHPLAYYRRDQTILSDKKEIINQKLHDIEENLNYLFKQIKIKPESVTIPLEQEKIKIEAANIEELVENLHELTENESRRMKGYNNDLKKFKDLIEYDLAMKKTLEWLLQFRINSGILLSFNQLRFNLYKTSHATMRQFLEALQSSDISIVTQSLDLTASQVVFFLIYHKTHSDSIKELIRNHKIQILEDYGKYLTTEGIIIMELEKNLVFYNARLDRANNILEDAKKHAIRYRAYLEILENIRKFLHIEEQFVVSSQNMIVRFEAFVPTKFEKTIVETLFTKFPQKIRIKVEPIEQKPDQEVKEKSEAEIENELKNGESKKITQGQKVPSLVFVNKIVKPFKLLVNMYGTPAYSELDPTPILALTYPILFGMMFGDLGHGLVLLIVGLLLIFKNRKQKQKSTYDFGFLLLWLGIAAMVLGFIYGEVFGYEFKELYMMFYGVTEEQVPVILTKFLYPILNIKLILKIAILAGVIHIILGWTMMGINFILNKRVYLAFSDCVLKSLLLIGGTYLIFTYFFDLTAWLTPPYPILYVAVPTVLLLIAKPFGKIVLRIPYLTESMGSMIGFGTIDLAETFLNILSNVASYSRILALSMAHMGLMLIIRTLVDMVGGNWLFIPIVLIFGNLFVIVLEGVLVFIHTLRLHFYEFFGKFYAGNGIVYHNVQIKNDYSEMKFVLKK